MAVPYRAPESDEKRAGHQPHPGVYELVEGGGEVRHSQQRTHRNQGPHDNHGHAFDNELFHACSPDLALTTAERYCRFSLALYKDRGRTDLRPSSGYF